jgi:hypothetical protein
MMARPFLPIAARIAAIGAAVIAGGLCLRHFYIDSDTVRTLCDAAPEQLFCTARTVFSRLLRHPALGWAILALTLLTLIRPTPLRLGAAFAVVCAGLALYQADLASGAGALLLISLAIQRPQQQGNTP